MQTFVEEVAPAVAGLTMILSFKLIDPSTPSRLYLITPAINPSTVMSEVNVNTICGFSISTFTPSSLRKSGRPEIVV